MNIKNLTEKVEGKQIVVANQNIDVKTGYCGDFLSFVMANAPENCVWFTVMTNVNVVGVAVMADIKAICICENQMPDDALIEKAKEQNINIVSTKMDVFTASQKVFN